MLTNPGACGIIITERGNKKNEKEIKKMSIEYFEIMGDAMDEVQEWLDFEADLAESNPWD